MKFPLVIRPFAQDRDAAAVISLIDEIYREYGDPGVDLKQYDQDLLNIDRDYRETGGEFIVATVKEQIVASHATLPVDRATGKITFRRLYLDANFRGSGIADQVMDWAVDWSRAANFRWVEFWSDVRFTRAHRFFERFGFVSDGSIRHEKYGDFCFSEKRFTLDL